MCLVTVLSERKRDWKADFKYSQEGGKIICLPIVIAGCAFETVCSRLGVAAAGAALKLGLLADFWVQVRLRSDLRVLLFPPDSLHAAVQPLSYSIVSRCFFVTRVIEIVFFGLASPELPTLALFPNL